MPKKLVAAVAMFAIGIVGSFYYARSKLVKVPVLVQELLRNEGVAFHYENFQLLSGLKFSLDNIYLSVLHGERQIFGRRAIAALEIAASWPPVGINVSLDGVVLGPSTLDRFPSSLTLAKKRAPAWLLAAENWFSKVVTVQFTLRGAEIADLQWDNIVGKITLKNLAFNSAGLEKATLHHQLLFQRLTRSETFAPFVNNAHWEGVSQYDGRALKIKDHQVSWGPFVWAVNGNYAFNSQQWKLTLGIPQTSLSPGTNRVNARALGWLKAISGNLKFELVAEGIRDRYNVRGSFTAKNIHATVNTDSVNGDIVGDADFDFAEPGIRGSLRADLSAISVRSALFAKKVGVASTCNVLVEPLGETNEVKGIEFTLGKAKWVGQGTFRKDFPFNSNLRFNSSRIAAPDLAQSFPALGVQNGGGSGELRGEYAGPLLAPGTGNWKINLAVQKLILSPSPELFFAGPSRTEGSIVTQGDLGLEWQNSRLVGFNAHGSLGFGSARVEVPPFYSKPPGTPLTLEFNAAGFPKIYVREFRADGYGGAVSGTLTLDAGQRPFGVASELKIAKLDLGKLASAIDLAGPAREVTGVLSGDASLDFSGRNYAEVWKSLSGVGKLSILNFRLPKVTIAPLAALSALPELSQQVARTLKEEKVTQMNASFNVQKEKLVVKDFSISTPQFDVVASDPIDLSEFAIAGRVQWLPKAGLMPKEWLEIVTGGKKKIGIPLELSGRPGKIEVTADLKAIEERFRQLASHKIKEQLEGHLRGKLGHAVK